ESTGRKLLTGRAHPTMVSAELPVKVAPDPTHVAANVIGEVELRAFGLVAIGIGVARVTVGEELNDGERVGITFGDTSQPQLLRPALTHLVVIEILSQSRNAVGQMQVERRRNYIIVIETREDRPVARIGCGVRALQRLRQRAVLQRAQILPGIEEVEQMLISEVVIDFEAPRILFGSGRRGRQIIVLQARSRRLWNQRQNISGDIAEPILRNDIARERLSGDGIIYQLARKQFGEISL